MGVTIQTPISRTSNVIIAQRSADSMNNEVFVGNLLNFLNFILKSVGLAPFCYVKSRKLFAPCKMSTFLSYVISGLILIASLPVELASASHFKPYRVNTVSYAIIYLHIVFSLVKIWLNQIVIITNRRKIVRHFNQALHINDTLKALCSGDHLLDDRMIRRIKSRISLFILQSIAIIFGVNAYISRSFFQYSAALVVRIFICFSYINAIFVTTIYLGGSLMLCERYCCLLCKRVRRLMEDADGNDSTIGPSNERQRNLEFGEKFNEILKVYDVVVLFIDNSHNLFGSHAVICACSTFLVSLHGTFTLYCSVRNGELIQTNKLLIDVLITICYVKFKFIEFSYIIFLSSKVKRKIEELHFLVQGTTRFSIDGSLIDNINLLAIQMEQTKPNYTFGGLLTFDKQFFFSVVVTVASFLLILIQFDIAAEDLSTLNITTPSP